MPVRKFNLSEIFIWGQCRFYYMVRNTVYGVRVKMVVPIILSLCSIDLTTKWIMSMCKWSRTEQEGRQLGWILCLVYRGILHLLKVFLALKILQILIFCMKNFTYSINQNDNISNSSDPPWKHLNNTGKTFPVL